MHTAVEKQVDASVIRLLATPKSVPIHNYDGHIAMDLACRRGATAECLEILLAALEGHPEAARETLQAEDQDGNLPLHRLCLNLDMDPECIRDLLNLYPEALHHRNHNDDTPVELVLLGRPSMGELPVWSELRLQMARLSPPEVHLIERNMVEAGTHPLHRMCELDSSNLELLQFRTTTRPPWEW